MTNYEESALKVAVRVARDKLKLLSEVHEERLRARKSKEKCPFFCIFDGERLVGDCRIPWSKDCALNKRDHDRSEAISLP